MTLIEMVQIDMDQLAKEITSVQPMDIDNNWLEYWGYSTKKTVTIRLDDA